MRTFQILSTTRICHEHGTETVNYSQAIEDAMTPYQAVEAYFNRHWERFNDRDFTLTVNEKHSVNIEGFREEAKRLKIERDLTKKLEEAERLNHEIEELKKMNLERTVW